MLVGHETESRHHKTTVPAVEALITYAGNLKPDAAVAAEARRLIEEVLAEHQRFN